MGHRARGLQRRRRRLEYFPHDHARSRAYRWSEDGLAGICDIEQRLCLALALWNGRDPILKERIFGLTGTEGNHGEDAKEYWWYLDAHADATRGCAGATTTRSARSRTPSLVAENARRGRHEPEYELLDTGVFDDDRYWVVEVDYAKADPDDCCIRVRVTQRRPGRGDAARAADAVVPQHLVVGPARRAAPAARARGDGHAIVAEHATSARSSCCGPARRHRAELLFCDNETNTERLCGSPDAPPYPKDGINDHVVARRRDRRPASGAARRRALWYRLRCRRARPWRCGCGWPAAPADGRRGRSARRSTPSSTQRRAEADEFYAELDARRGAGRRGAVMRQAFAGHALVQAVLPLRRRALARRRPGQPPPPPRAASTGATPRWRTLDAYDIISMPDPWEYPWFAAWDLAFHCVALAHVDPAFAK